MSLSLTSRRVADISGTNTPEWVAQVRSVYPQWSHFILLSMISISSLVKSYNL